MPDPALRGAPWRWPARVLVVVAALAAIALLSNLPQGRPSADGHLRLAWRAAAEQVRLCRQRSEAELNRLAPHMRQALECRQRTLPYRLAVHVDGRERIARPVTSAGAQGDRPLYVQEELVLPPGEHALRIAFIPAPELAQQPGGIAVDNAEQRAALQQALDRAPAFRLERTVRSEPGRIVLVELNEREGGFVVRGG